MTFVYAPRSVLVTGAAGYVGSQVIERLSQAKETIGKIIALDIRIPSNEKRNDGVLYLADDIRNPGLARLMLDHQVDSVIHLASVVTPPKTMTREDIYSVDVNGTENILHACIKARVRQIIVTSSGAAYGYHADNPVPLEEHHPLRGNAEFTYSHHKRLIEEMLAQYRTDHPELRQLIFRVCTVLGASTNNQITALFKKPFFLGVKGAQAPFVFIWDQDLVECLVRGVLDNRQGIYNIAGDGVMSMQEIARVLGKPYIEISPRILRTLLRIFHQLGLSQYGPEQVGFLQYRPVLGNRRLRKEFGYTPLLSAEKTFEYYLAAQQQKTKPIESAAYSQDQAEVQKPIKST